MRARKARVTVTVDRALLEAGERAVARGRADSLSGWINRALVERVEKEKRLLALAEAVAAYEAAHGGITTEEIEERRRLDRRAARKRGGGP